MYIKLNPNSAKSSLGFVIERIGRSELKYTEKDHIIIIEVEDGSDYLALYIPNILNWLPPFGDEMILNNKKKKIIKNICNALDYLNIKYIITAT